MTSRQTTEEDFLIGEQRTWPRIQTSFPAMYADKDGYFHEEKVINLSKGGLYLETHNPLKKDDRLEMILQLPDQSCEITVQGQVMHADTINGNPLSGMGIMFTTVEPNLKKWLGHFIDRLFHADGGGERKEPRVAAPLNQIKISASDIDQSALLCNLSRNGMLVRTQHPLCLFEQVSTLLTHPDTYLNFELQGEVVHIYKKELKSHPYYTGIKFDGIDQATRETILDLVREIMFRQQIADIKDQLPH